MFLLSLCLAFMACLGVYQGDIGGYAGATFFALASIINMLDEMLKAMK